MRDDYEASPFDLDRRRLRQALERAASGYDAATFLHREVGNRLLARLNLIKHQPETIVDVGCATGAITAALMKKYRKAKVIGLDLAPALVKRACKRAPWLRTLHGAVAEPEALPLPSASCDLVFSHFALPWCLDLDRVFAEFQRVLKPEGVLLFSTLGPDTLIELRRSWAAADGYNHINTFLDMHDIGDALMRARLADPVMDVERLTLTYPDVGGLMRDLKVLGAQQRHVRARPWPDRQRPTAGHAVRLRTVPPPRRSAARQLRGSLRPCLGINPGSVRPRGDGAAVFPLAQLRRRDHENS
jgi:malonyl-CoA O-methyltransferase